MAKVMENLIQQNFETKIFNQFSTWFSTKALNSCFRVTINGFFGDFQRRILQVQNHGEISCSLLPYYQKKAGCHHGIDRIPLGFRRFPLDAGLYGQLTVSEDWNRQLSLKNRKTRG
jgi:hypothetical protein